MTVVLRNWDLTNVTTCCQPAEAIDVEGILGRVARLLLSTFSNFGNTTFVLSKTPISSLSLPEKNVTKVGHAQVQQTPTLLTPQLQSSNPSRLVRAKKNISKLVPSFRVLAGHLLKSSATVYPISLNKEKEKFNARKCPHHPTHTTFHFHHTTPHPSIPSPARPPALPASPSR